MSKKERILSPSRMKTLEDCTWRYWCNYHLMLPQKQNDGAMRGTICHLVFELILGKERDGHLKLLIDKGLDGVPSVKRLVISHLKKAGRFNDENYDLCNDMIVVGLNTDFWMNGSEDLEAEREFLIESEKPKYKCRGFIDKSAVYKNKNLVKIVDYKSSKYKFRGEELTANFQAMAYTIAAKKIWPDIENVVAEFQFLRFPKQPVQQVEASKDQLEGFEHYMAFVYEQINNFTEEKATSKFAAGSPKTRWLCKAGKTWRCPYLDSFEYYAIKNEDGNIIKTAFEKEELIESMTAKTKMVKMKYNGCPAHYQE